MRYLSPIECAIEAFGNQSKLARRIGCTPGNISWIKTHSGKIQAELQRKILDAAEEDGAPITAEELIRGRVVHEPVPEPHNVSEAYRNYQGLMAMRGRR